GKARAGRILSGCCWQRSGKQHTSGEHARNQRTKQESCKGLRASGRFYAVTWPEPIFLCVAPFVDSVSDERGARSSACYLANDLNGAHHAKVVVKGADVAIVPGAVNVARN